MGGEWQVAQGRRHVFPDRQELSDYAARFRPGVFVWILHKFKESNHPVAAGTILEQGTLTQKVEKRQHSAQREHESISTTCKLIESTDSHVYALCWPRVFGKLRDQLVKVPKIEERTFEQLQVANFIAFGEVKLVSQERQDRAQRWYAEQSAELSASPDMKEPVCTAGRWSR